MGDSTVVELPKGLKHWINSVKTASCTLVRELTSFHCNVQADTLLLF